MVHSHSVSVLFGVDVGEERQRVNSALSAYSKRLVNIVRFYETFHASDDTLPIVLLYGPSGSGKTRLVESLCAQLSLHLHTVSGMQLAGESASAIEKRIEHAVQQSLAYGPCILLIKSVFARFIYRVVYLI